MNNPIIGFMADYTPQYMTDCAVLDLQDDDDICKAIDKQIESDYTWRV